MEHISQVHTAVGETLKTSRPDFHLFQHLWQKKLISDSDFKELKGGNHNLTRMPNIFVTTNGRRLRDMRSVRNHHPGRGRIPNRAFETRPTGIPDSQERVMKDDTKRDRSHGTFGFLSSQQSNPEYAPNPSESSHAVSSDITGLSSVSLPRSLDGSLDKNAIFKMSKQRSQKSDSGYEYNVMIGAEQKLDHVGVETVHSARTTDQHVSLDLQNCNQIAQTFSNDLCQDLDLNKRPKTVQARLLKILPEKLGEFILRLENVAMSNEECKAIYIIRQHQRYVMSFYYMYFYMYRSISMSAYIVRPH